VRGVSEGGELIDSLSNVITRRLPREMGVGATVHQRWLRQRLCDDLPDPCEEIALSVGLGLFMVLRKRNNLIVSPFNMPVELRSCLVSFFLETGEIGGEGVDGTNRFTERAGTIRKVIRGSTFLESIQQLFGAQGGGHEWPFLADCSSLI
jgi:hypothetical protein